MDNFIRGLSDEEIQSKVFAMQEEDCTSEKVLRFVEAEELGRSSVLDIRPAGEAQQISGYMRSKMTGLPPPNPTPGKKCWRCKQNHSPETRRPQWKEGVMGGTESTVISARRRDTPLQGVGYVLLTMTNKSRLVIIILLKLRLPIKPQ